MLTCKNCQTPYHEYQAFCTQCGQALATADSFSQGETTQGGDAQFSPSRADSERVSNHPQQQPSFYDALDPSAEQTGGFYDVTGQPIDYPTAPQPVQQAQPPQNEYPRVAQGQQAQPPQNEYQQVQQGQPGRQAGDIPPIPPASGPKPSPYRGAGSGPATPQLSLNRVSVAVVAILFGAVGLQYIMMRKWFRAGLCIAFTVLAFSTGIQYISTLPGMIGIMQGLRILCLTQDQFSELYLTADYVIPPPPRQQPRHRTYPGV